MKRCSNINKKFVDYVFWGIVIFSFVILTSLCFNDSVWIDEAFSAVIIRESYVGMVEATARDVHPPLYYIVLKLFTSIVGYRLFVMKLVSVLGTVCTLVLGGTKIRKRFGNKTAFIFVTLSMAMPNMLLYGVEVRMYSWAMFFVTASALYAYEIILDNRIQSWIFFVFYSLCGAYTHYYALIPIGLIYMLLLIYFIVESNERVRMWLIASGITCLLYFPWWQILLQQIGSVKEDYWIPEITWISILEYVIFFFYTGEMVSSVLLCSVIVSLFLIYMKKFRQEVKENEDYFALSCLFVFVGTIILGITVSLFVKPVFIARYMIPSTGLLWLFIARAITRLKSKSFILVIIIMLLIGTNNYILIFDKEYHTQTETTKDYFSNNLQKNDIFIHTENHLKWCFSYYFPDNKQIMDYDWNDNIKNIDGTIWLIKFEESDPFINSQQKEIIEKNYYMEYQVSSGVDYYMFDIYKLIKKASE